jgi:alpha-beta hydrolase superfamily lysophospholipase
VEQGDAVATTFDLDVDVTEAAGLGEPVSVRATVTLPDPDALSVPPVVCFAYPGGGYSRGYYTADLPGPGTGAQAAWHAERGWIFVACDHLGVGASSLPDPATLTFPPLTAANDHAARHVLALLASGTLAGGFPSVREPVTIGIGQSMGACFTVVQQARHGTFDGIGVLGFSAIHTYPPTAPGVPDQPFPYVARDGGEVVNQPMMELRAALWAQGTTEFDVNAMAWGFHYDDVPREVVQLDLADFPTRQGRDVAWASRTVPGVVTSLLSPGCIAAEAASILDPVLVAAGARDVVPDPWAEPRAYKASTDVTVFVCPRMGHMHNFASSRELLWRRIEAFGDGVAALRGHTARWVTELLR